MQLCLLTGMTPDYWCYKLPDEMWDKASVWWFNLCLLHTTFPRYHQSYKPLRGALIGRSVVEVRLSAGGARVFFFFFCGLMQTLPNTLNNMHHFLLGASAAPWTVNGNSHKMNAIGEEGSTEEVLCRPGAAQQNRDSKVGTRWKHLSVVQLLHLSCETEYITASDYKLPHFIIYVFIYLIQLSHRSRVLPNPGEIKCLCSDTSL